jgi:hypothetical protein
MTDSMLTVLAFLTRSLALVALILLYLYFRKSSGKLVRPIRQVIGSFTFLLFWVWCASLGEITVWWPHGGRLVEYGSSWIWVPNSVISVTLVQLLIRLYLRDLDDVA